MRKPKLGDGPHHPTWNADSPYMTSVVRNLRESFPEFANSNRVSAQDLINFYRYEVGYEDDDEKCIENAREAINEQLNEDVA